MTQKILIIDFGSPYTQLIAGSIRDAGVYSEIAPFNKVPVVSDEIAGIILADNPISLNEESKSVIDLEAFNMNVPVLGIGYGAQVLAAHLGGLNGSSEKGDNRKNLLKINEIESGLFKGMASEFQTFSASKATVESLPDQITQIKGSDNSIAAFEINNFYGVLFNPEIHQTENGTEILKNFVLNVCGCQPSYTPEFFINQSVDELKELLKNEEVVMALSGGVDSSVAAFLIHRAIGDRLHCIFVDHGLLRKNEFEQVLDSYQKLGLPVKGVNAKKQFYSALSGLSDPEDKRKAIGKTFIEIFEQEAKNIEGVKCLGQGTIYPDIIESVSTSGKVAVKSHHNVGGLPERMDLRIVEPLKFLFKQEVRKVGLALGLPNEMVFRHPFPGPGLGIRILGEITAKKVEVLQNADHVFISSLHHHDLYDKVWQAGVILLPIQSVGTSGGKRTYENVAALRAVSSIDGMTADCVPLSYSFLEEVSKRIISEVDGINRVVYDISSKPPATIEWE